MSSNALKLFTDRQDIEEVKKKNPHYNSFCNSIEIIFNDDNSNHYNNKKNVWDLLSGKRSAGISQSSFRKKKALLILFYQTLYDNGLINEEMLEYVKNIKFSDTVGVDEVERFLFKDLQEAISFIDMTEEHYAGKVVGAFLREKTIVILLWNGFSYQDMSNLLIKDINGTENTVSGIYIESPYFEIIQEYANSDYSMNALLDRKLRNVPSDHLFRSFKSPTVSYQVLKDIMNRFNQKCKRFGKGIYASSIRKNGMFYNVLMKELDGQNSSEVFAEIFGVDNSGACGDHQIYLKWKEKYYKFDVSEEK